MTNAHEKNVPVQLVVGGDPFLNEQGVKDLCSQVRHNNPDWEYLELDAATCDPLTFQEAVGPSLLSDCSIVLLEDLQMANERLGTALLNFCQEEARKSEPCSMVICQHDGSRGGSRLLDQLTRAGAVRVPIPELKRFEAKVNFVYSQFERGGRRIEPAAAQQLVDVLGDRTAELASMCSQLCDDCDQNPIGVKVVNTYLTDNPTVTGFMVADRALTGRGAEAVLALRSALEQGNDPISLIGVLAMKLRVLGRQAAIQSGAITAAEAKAPPWQLREARRQLPGWSSQGLAVCIEALAAADEECKTNAGSPQFALERAVELIASKGRASL